jgi:putative ABC transport system permease protein
MFRHNFLIIYRNFKRNQSSFFINLVGLSSGLACVLFIFLWVNDEYSFDRYHVKDKDLYQVMNNIKTEKGIETKYESPFQLAEVIPAEMPEVEYAVTVTPDHFFPAFTLTGNDKGVKGAGKFAGKDFFRMFSYKLVEGDPAAVLATKNSIVLSESLAQRLFKSTDIIGKTISSEIPGFKLEGTVTGVYQDVPVNSSERFDFVLPFDNLKAAMGMQPGWNAEPFKTYLALNQGVNIEVFTNKLSSYINKNAGNKDRSFFLKHFSDNYLYNKYENGIVSGGRIEYVKLFSLIAAFVLLISCINFMNLSTAKAVKRIKEVGIKKAIGVNRRFLIAQYLGESLLLTFISLIVALIVVVLLLPEFNIITEKNLALHFNAPLYLMLFGVTIITGLLAGSYPAIYLSGFKPAMVLKGKFSSSLAELWTRKGLVVFQFSLSIVFIVSILVFYKQIEYVQNKNLGFDKNNLIYFEAQGKTGQDPQAFLNDIQQIAGVEKASNMIGSLIAKDLASQGGLTWKGRTVPSHGFGVNYGMIETLGIKLRAGRSFSKDFNAKNPQILINQAAVDAMGLKNPVGTIVNKNNNSNGVEIIGVVDNFHFQSLHEKIEPVTFRLDNFGASTIVVKIKSGQEKQTIQQLETLYKSYNPGLTFDYKFLDQDYQALYRSERQVSVLSRYFASLAIIISCLGLFGLASFTAERRIKEIGIRKILGSDVFGIVRLLSVEFIKMVFIAIVIGLPCSYLFARNWLDGFAYKINLEWWYFIGAAALTIGISLMTVSFQSFKAAVANPVKSLRAD